MRNKIQRPVTESVLGCRKSGSPDFQKSPALLDSRENRLVTESVLLLILSREALLSPQSGSAALGSSCLSLPLSYEAFTHRTPKSTPKSTKTRRKERHHGNHSSVSFNAAHRPNP